MAATPLERFEQMFNVSIHPSNFRAHFQNTVHGILFLRNTYSSKRIALERLRFNSPQDRRLMDKYQLMEKYIEHVERLKIISPQHSHKVDMILNIINNQNRNVTMESLSSYDHLLEVAAEFYPKALQKFFELDFLKLENLIENPLANHTLRRTYHPKLDYFFGIDIKVPIKYQLGQWPDVETSQDIPHALQGEIAGLNQKFRISLDPTGSFKSIRLMCCLEDDLLPSVPPIYLDIPESYPFCSPKCIIMQHDYSATTFLLSVQTNLTGSISNLPKCYSVTHILNSWEMSIRKASYFENTKFTSFNMIYEMLIQ